MIVLPQNTPFVLFGCVIAVRGSERSTICDLQRKFYRFIPNSLQEVLDEHQGKSLSAIKAIYNNEYDEVIDEYFELLENEEYIFFTETPNLFPKMSMQWEDASLITNAIIDIEQNSKDDYSQIFEQLEFVACKHIQLRIFKNIDTNYINEVMLALENRRILSIEWLLPYNDLFAKEKFISLQRLISQYPRIFWITLYNAPDTSLIYFSGSVMGHIYNSAEPLTNHSHCGSIARELFSINIKTFTESQHHNTCLNRKISIDSDGYIKNCPSMAHHFGHISEVRLEDVIKNPEFTKYWHIKKDQISVCCDCEFRHICTDCRAYIENPADLYSKPLKCGYNPYTCEWEEWSTNPLKQAAIMQYGLQDLVVKS